MSVSDEAYYEKFRAFTDIAFPLFTRDPEIDRMAAVAEGMKYTPQRVREFLSAYAQMLGSQKPILDKLDEIGFCGMPGVIPGRTADRQYWCDKAWHAIRAWDDLVATCGSLDELAHKAQTVKVDNGQLVSRPD